MTQPPPPPPNQPPQQPGFGPPTPTPPPDQPAAPPAPPAPPVQQPQPGYGYPQQPEPGYGYPQQPPAPQPPQSGYGYPGGQPAAAPYGAPGAQNPYAQPTPPMQGAQPGYGYPGQPQTVPIQPAPAGGGRNNTALFIVVAAVVAIALIVGGGIWYAGSSGGDGKKSDTASSGGKNGTGGTGATSGSGGTGDAKEKVPADPASSVLFQVPMPTTDDLVSTPGSWLTDKVYAKSGIAEVVGYDPATGAKRWTIKLPGPVCQASEHIGANDLTAIAYQPKMPAKNSFAGCSQIAAIDLDAGKKLWTKTVNSGDSPISFENVTVAQHTVAVGSTSGGAALDLDSGKLLWQPKTDDTCYDAGYGGGAKLVAVRKCGDFGSQQVHIQNIDPRSGKVIADYTMDSGIDYASVVSTDPLVVAAQAGADSKSLEYFSLDDKTGKLLAHISAPNDTYGGRCETTTVESCKEIVVGGGKLYLPTAEHDGNGELGSTNEIVSFDLTTGKPTGQRVEAGDGYTLSPLRMDGPNLLAYKRPPYNKGGQIVSIEGVGSKATELLENPSAQDVRNAETSMLPDSAEILFGDGRLFMSAVFANKPYAGAGKQYLVTAFGTKG
ncbi:PQQ-binding-like beta-propeller repeat protein [Streptomyces monashensis]|uniref:Pyrrolo-quinoline quinone repeat domain-containing protein n=1 Tax=Streptomyces monashensis TaxID=1678012 RepID=A0A1S2QP95_9ACTN|nr:PQQ-binding-like beta-propeller repeat protein [Streptomyces monashensis]OIK07276.1 hypothetical protein BIV23_04155 [Streptomyces monashensis]